MIKSNISSDDNIAVLVQKEKKNVYTRLRSCSVNFS